MNKNNYLTQPHVTGFIGWLASAIRGDTPVIHSFHIRDPRLPRNYPYNRSFRVNNLESAFLRYFWDQKNYDENAMILAPIQDAVLQSVENQDPDATMRAVHEILRWGAGGVRTKLYTANMGWAQRQGENLVGVLQRGRLSINSDELADVAVFSQNNGPRMNAGYTKYYALACGDSIIYDGRVGAALGLLVRNYCIDSHLDVVPTELSFRWGPQNGTNPLNRDPSQGTLVFNKLPIGGSSWAEWNKKANWILQSAIDAVDVEWVHAADSLRRLEASLFMLGYSMDALPN